MKVLITGMTAVQVGRDSKYKYVSSPRLMAAGLRDAGHDVEHRETIPAEPLGSYDVVLVGLSSPTGLASSRRWTGLDVIGRATREGCALAAYVDDFRLPQIRHNFDYVNRDPKRLVKSMWQNDRNYGWAVENLDHLAAVSEELGRRWPMTIVPKFAWGDGSILQRELPHASSVEFVDPSPYVPVEGYPARTRERKWVSAALANGDAEAWVDDLPTSWPIERYSSRKGCVTVPESVLLRRYGETRGVLSIPHKAVLGGGWWRLRFNQAAHTGSIIYTNRREVSDLGKAFMLSVAEIEALTDKQLDELAAEQRDELLRWQWSAERFREELDRIVRSAIGDDSGAAVCLDQDDDDEESVVVVNTDKINRPAKIVHYDVYTGSPKVLAGEQRCGRCGLSVQNTRCRKVARESTDLERRMGLGPQSMWVHVWCTYPEAPRPAPTQQDDYHW